MQDVEVTFLINERTRQISRLTGIKAELVGQGLDPKGEEYAKQLRMNWDSPCPILGLCEQIEAAKKRFAST